MLSLATERHFITKNGDVLRESAVKRIMSKSPLEHDFSDCAGVKQKRYMSK